MNFDDLCKMLTDYIEEITAHKVNNDTLLMDEYIIDSFSMLSIIDLLETELRVDVQPGDLSSDHFINVTSIAQWALQLPIKKSG
ncbi:MAG: hypothetical protein V7744_19895 [Pseudomonadales bacterium]